MFRNFTIAPTIYAVATTLPPRVLFRSSLNRVCCYSAPYHGPLHRYINARECPSQATDTHSSGVPEGRREYNEQGEKKGKRRRRESDARADQTCVLCPCPDHIAFECVLIALDCIIIFCFTSVEEAVHMPAHVRLDVHGQTLLDQRVSFLLALQTVERQSLHGEGL